MEKAFHELAKENDPGRITVLRTTPNELTIEVNRVGTYTFSTNFDSQFFSL